MAADLLNKWLGVWQPLTLGQFGDAGANGLALTCGQFWQRTGGGYTLYRWTGDRTPAAPDTIVGAAVPGATEIRTFPRVAHAASTRYWYLLRAVGAGGVEETNTRRVVEAVTDAAGDLQAPRPNSPSALVATPLADGDIELSWSYVSAGQQVAPAAFAVYGDGAAGHAAIDYETVIATVTATPGQSRYATTLTGYDHGDIVRLAVRAISAAGVHDGNTDDVVGVADATDPVAPTLVAAYGDEA